jgi:glycosyltransferase involved in cell wall biosynthesis
MKVFFDHQIFLLQKYGGISRYIYKLNQYLNYMKIRPIICAPISINEHLVLLKKNKINHFKFNKIYKYCNKAFNLYNNFFTELYLKKFEPDVIHQTYYKRNYNIKKRTPVILTVYDLIHEKLYKTYKLSKNNKWKEEAIKSADHVICISKNTQSDLLNFYDIDKNKTSVIHLATDIKLTSIDLEKYNLIFKKKFILYVGERSRYKNFINLIKAFSSSNSLINEFNIICCGSESFSNEEKSFFSKNNLKVDTIQHITATDAQLNYLYKNATAFIFPSKYEGFGLPAIEAISLGCPVLASDIQIFREILGNNVIYFNPNDIHSIKKALEENLFSKKKLKDFSIKGLEHSKKYSWEKCAQKTLDVYKKVI